MQLSIGFRSNRISIWLYTYHPAPCFPFCKNLEMMMHRSSALTWKIALKLFYLSAEMYLFDLQLLAIDFALISNEK